MDPSADGIRQNLRAVVGGCESARASAATACQRAHQIAQRATRDRFLAVAQGMQHIQQRLRSIDAAIGDAIRSVNKVLAQVSAASDETSVHGVTSRLSPAVNELSAVHARSGAVVEDIAKVDAEIQQTLRGGKPEPLLAITAQIRRGIVEVAERSDAARSGTEQLINVAHALGSVASSDQPRRTGPGRLDSRGRPIPPGVSRLPSGKLPANFTFAGKKFQGKTWSPWLAEKYPDGVQFTDDGFPDFSPYAMHTVTLDPNFRGDRTTDFTRANGEAGLSAMPDGYIWHHHQDTRTMQLIPEDLHEAVRHAGGVAIMKDRRDEA